MKYILYRILKPILLPPAWIALALLAALILLKKKKKKIANGLICGVLIIYYILSIKPGADLMSYPIERYEHNTELEIKMADDTVCIVILSAGLNLGGKLRRKVELSGESLTRLFYGTAFYHSSGRKYPVLFTGGIGNPFHCLDNASTIIRDAVRAMGVSETDIIVDADSRNTYESAIAAGKIIRKKMPGQKRMKIILVTTALHMRRSAAVFEKQGFEVLAYPVGYRTGSIDYSPIDFIPNVCNFATSSYAIHEWLGIIFYRLKGRI